MSTATIVTIKCREITLIEAVFSKIDNCFEKNGFEPFGQIGVYPPLPDFLQEPGGYDSDKMKEYRAKNKIFDYRERAVVASRGTSMESKYIQKNGSVFVGFSIVYTPDLVCSHMRLAAKTAPGQTYSKEGIIIARALYDISMCLHKTFDAVDTRAMVDNWEDDHEPWFQFSDTNWKTAEFVLNEDETN